MAKTSEQIVAEAREAFEGASTMLARAENLSDAVTSATDRALLSVLGAIGTALVGALSAIADLAEQEITDG